MTRFIKILGLVGLTVLVGCGPQQAGNTQYGTSATSNASNATNDSTYYYNPFSGSTTPTSYSTQLGCAITLRNSTAAPPFNATPGQLLNFTITATGGTGTSYSFGNLSSGSWTEVPTAASSATTNQVAYASHTFGSSDFYGQYILNASVRNNGTTATCQVTINFGSSGLNLTSNSNFTAPTSGSIQITAQGVNVQPSSYLYQVLDASAVPPVPAQGIFVQANGGSFTLSQDSNNQNRVMTNLVFSVKGLASDGTILAQSSANVSFINPLNCRIIAPYSAAVNTNVTFAVVAYDQYNQPTNEPIAITSIDQIPFTDIVSQTQTGAVLKFTQAGGYVAPYLATFRVRSLLPGLTTPRTCALTWSIYIY